MTSTLPPTVHPERIREVLDGRWAHVRRDAREHLDDPEFAPVYGETLQEARERITRLSAKLAGTGRVGLVRSAADWWLRTERPMLRTELAAHLTDLAWAGLSGVVTPSKEEL